MATRRLILLRHAKSDWHSGASTDFERPLNHRGRRDAPRVGDWLNSHVPEPDVICCSSAARARETLQLVSTEFDISSSGVLYLDDLYHATEQEIVQIAVQQLAQVQTVMMVGHNPGFELALMHFCPEVSVPGDGKLMTTCCVAIIEFDDEYAVNKEHGRLDHLRRPD